ncbi:MAG TPA: hypothetical protein VM076_19025 [Gemmatimonadaceae bacterium]|nr:hypothetical protein [Gemmatimonadaceae bacterium]
MTKLIERAAAVALVVLGAARADAQITTVIEPPKKAQAKVQEAARREEVAQDSIARITLTGMKQWVDSAAGSLALRPDTGTAPSETNVPVAPPQTRADSATKPARQTAAPDSVFRNGARAPNTATPAPTVALIGATMVLAGLAMRRRRRQPAPQRR